MPVNLKDVLARNITAVHEALFRATDGRVGGRIVGMEALILGTTGRRSGKPRSTMLTAPLVDDDGSGRVVLVASYGGDDRDPTWFLNLRANPDVTITMRGSTSAYRARVATPAEKSALWPSVVAAYKGYAGYQDRTERDIPLVICERV